MRKTGIALSGVAAVMALGTGLTGTAAAAPRLPANAGDRCVAYLQNAPGYPGNATAYSACYSAYNGNFDYCLRALSVTSLPWWAYLNGCTIAWAGD